ncbi:MAG: M23 family metallopeptidase [Magnetococcales bacterium]|nr:M23 family metallopeptidase [Magnetococcales bacterium]
MQSLYPISVLIRNQSLRFGAEEWGWNAQLLWNETWPRFFTLLVPALLGSLAVSSWLSGQGGSTPLPLESPVVVQVGKPVDSSGREAFRSISGLADQTLLPTLAALEGLFVAPGEGVEPLLEVEPDLLPAPFVPARGLTPLEVHVNETLLAAIDPYLLNREQKNLFASVVPTGYPIPFQGITSPFGFRLHPTHQETRFHPGVDLQAPMNTRVMATADGVVEFAGVDTGKLGMNGLGQVVSVNHNFGFTSTYGHLNKVLVKAGDFVKKGELIGMSGQSGLVTAPHLHYEIRFIHQYLNPAPFLAWSRDHPERLFREKSVKWLALIEMISTRTAPFQELAAQQKTPPSPPVEEATDQPSVVVTASHPLRPKTPR